MRYCILGLLLTVGLTAWAQPPDTLWTRSYAGASNALSVANTPDGGFIISAWTGMPYDGVLLKMDSLGSIQWQRSYGSPETFETLDDAKPCPSGGYVAVGRQFGHPTFDSHRTYVVRTNDQGDTLWTRTMDFEGDDDLGAVEVAANGDIICVGRAGYIGATSDSGDVLIMRYADTGYLVWTHRYRGNQSSIGFDVIKLGNMDHYLVGGQSGRFWEDSAAQAYVLAFNGDGDTLWTRTYRLDTYNQCLALAAADDGGFAFTGEVKPDPSVTSDLLILRADSLGEPLWQGRFGPGSARALSCLPDGSLTVFYGSMRIPDQGFQYAVKRLNAEGDSLWTGYYGTAADNYLTAGLTLPDQGYLMLGLVPGVYVVRTLPEPHSATYPQPVVPASHLLLSAYPNPFNATTTVTYWLPHGTRTQLMVYDILGRQVQAFAPAWLPPGNHQLRLASEGWSSGPYFLRLESGKEAATIKLLLEK